MKQVNVTTLGTPPAFSIPTSDPLYWLLRLCYEKSVDRYNYNQAGIVYKELEASDITALNTSLSSDFDSFTQWWEAFLVDNATTFVGNLMDLAPLITAIANGGASEVLPLLIGQLVNAIMVGSNASGKSGSNDAGEVAESQASSLFDELTLTINNNKDDGDYESVWEIAT